MSIDDVHSTFHLDLPFSLSSMVQEMGRSGRDGRRTENIILYNKQSASGQIANYANELQVVAICLHHVSSRYAVGWGGGACQVSPCLSGLAFRVREWF